jgi:hypothetical protein
MYRKNVEKYVDFNKLPDDVEFPLLKLVVDIDFLFDEYNKKPEGFYILTQFLSLAYCTPESAIFPGYADSNRLVVHVALVAQKNPVEADKFLALLEYNGFTNFFDQSLFEVCFVEGETFFSVVKSLNPHLFLCADVEIAREATGKGIPSAYLNYKNLKNSVSPLTTNNEFSIVFDLDSVVFGDSSEKVFAETGSLYTYRKNEDDKRYEPVEKGPLFGFLRALLNIRALFIDGCQKPFRLGIVTMRGGYAGGQARAFYTLNSYGFSLNQFDFYAGTCGQDKGHILQALGAFIFFDDGMRHIINAEEHGIFAFHVPWGVKNEPKKVKEPPKEKSGCMVCDMFCVCSDDKLNILEIPKPTF